jgi:hypothetical protein
MGDVEPSVKTIALLILERSKEDLISSTTDETSADVFRSGEIIRIPTSLRYLSVGPIRTSLVLGNFFLFSKFFAAAAAFGEFVKAQKRAIVEEPAAEFVELREQTSSVARAV